MSFHADSSDIPYLEALLNHQREWQESLSNTQIGHIDQEHRREVVEFIHVLYTDMKCKTSGTFQLAVAFLDRFRQQRTFNYITSSQMKLFAAACILIAAKFYEIHAPTVSKLIGHANSEFNDTALLWMEQEILDTLQWRMHSILPLHFSAYFLSTLEEKNQVHMLNVLRTATEDYMAFGLFDMDFVDKFTPLSIAIACILLASDDDIFSDNGIIQSHIIYQVNPYLSAYHLQLSEIYDCLAHLHRMVKHVALQSNDPFHALHQDDSLLSDAQLDNHLLNSSFSTESDKSDTFSFLEHGSTSRYQSDQHAKHTKSTLTLQDEEEEEVDEEHHTAPSSPRHLSLTGWDEMMVFLDKIRQQEAKQGKQSITIHPSKDTESHLALPPPSTTATNGLRRLDSQHTLLDQPLDDLYPLESISVVSNESFHDAIQEVLN